MGRAIVKYTKPNGSICFHAYGPTTDKKSDATRFINPSVARKAAMNRLGHGPAFWESERRSRDIARKQHINWKFEIIEESK